MATQVTINGTTYSIPSQGDSPPWGDDLHDLLAALVDVANTTVGPGDILTTSFNVANNQSSATNVTGLSFDTSTVRSAIIQYSLYRTSSTTEMSEVGHMYVTYKTTAGTWELAQSYAGSSGVTFSITNGGQVQYTSTNFSGVSYSGKMKFSAKAYLQT